MFPNTSEDNVMSNKLSKRYSEKFSFNAKKRKTKINGEEFEVHIPKNHTTIDGLIYKTWDANSWDDWANISDWQCICFTRKKGSKMWNKIYKGPLNNFTVNGTHIGGGAGLHKIYFTLETKATQKRMKKEAKIKFLKNERKRIEKELKELGVS